MPDSKLLFHIKLSPHFFSLIIYEIKSFFNCNIFSQKIQSFPHKKSTLFPDKTDILSPVKSFEKECFLHSSHYFMILEKRIHNMHEFYLPSGFDGQIKTLQNLPLPYRRFHQELHSSVRNTAILLW